MSTRRRTYGLIDLLGGEMKLVFSKILSGIVNTSYNIKPLESNEIPFLSLSQKSSYKNSDSNLTPNLDTSQSNGIFAVMDKGTYKILNGKVDSYGNSNSQAITINFTTGVITRNTTTNTTSSNYDITFEGNSTYSNPDSVDITIYYMTDARIE